MKTKKLLTEIRKKMVLVIAILFFTCVVFSQPFDQKVSTNSTTGTQEGEACIAINPTDSSKMVIGFMEQSQSSLNFRIYTSTNGGIAWAATAFNAQATLAADFPGRSIAGGGDILLAYDKTGKLYCSWIYALVKPGPTQLDSLLMVMYWGESTNNGASFTMQSSADKFINRGIMNYNTNQIYNVWDGIGDRQWMACDLSNGANANKLYCGYLLYPPNQSGTGLYVRSKNASSNTFGAKVIAYAGNGQLSNVLVDKNGTMHYVFGNIANNTVYHCSSPNGGTTFSTAHVIASGGILFPQSNKFINDRENAAVSFAIDGANNLHIVWNDFPGGTFPNAYYSYSTNGGQTWSAKLDLSQKFGNHVFMPTISAKNNKVTISANVLDNTKKSEYYILTSHDNGKNFSSPIKVSSGITDHTTAKTLFMGDYSTSVRTYCTIFSTWTDNRASGAKQYLAVYNECSGMGIQEIIPVNGSYSLSNVYPNPVRDELSIEILSQKSNLFNISLLDISGRILIRQELIASEGSNTFSMNLHHLDAGNYLLKVVDREEFMTTRIIVRQ